LPNICPIIEAPLLRWADLQVLLSLLEALLLDDEEEGGVIERRKEPNCADPGSAATSPATAKAKRSDLTSVQPLFPRSQRAPDQATQASLPLVN
jgi:hypothetical protein